MRTSSGDPWLILPVMCGFYRHIAEPVAFLGQRVLTGGLLVIGGWPKIQAPFAEAPALYPGVFWSAALAGTRFFGGMLLILGLWARPMVLACGVMLAVTLWFHLTHSYGTGTPTSEGIAAISGSAEPLFTPHAANPLLNLSADGGAGVPLQVRFKAGGRLYSFWTMETLFSAAYGGGRHWIN
ncbi:DoxX family membrane protein (plasmid) [Paracoccus kondratievae]|uniref:DoxX family protein n=1 Tax=Paracoccus kondratievae TaxID=135740 RepID=UPI0012664968|nr:DoxX family protein [Paracoccus kondratievae]QFQ89874.1 DoxX family membrane protein [Paracoccus kondratievae]